MIIYNVLYIYIYIYIHGAETADCGLLGERMLPSLRHAAAALARPAAAFLPCRADVWVMAVASPWIRSRPAHAPLDTVTSRTRPLDTITSRSRPPGYPTSNTSSRYCHVPPNTSSVMPRPHHGWRRKSRAATRARSRPEYCHVPASTGA